MNKNELFLCECSSPEHTVIMTYDNEDKDYPFVYMSVHLCKKPFFTRLKNGLKYIFGHRCTYGDFDEFIFKPEDSDRLKAVAMYLDECKKNQVK